MSVLINVPFFPQTDNAFNPNGACNVTAIAMCLWFLGIRGDGSQPQLEDQFYLWMIKNGLSRHNPYDLVKLVKSKNKRDLFTSKATIQQVKAHIDRGFPTVIHGFFTRSGHIIECHGYNDKGLICHDPYGDYKDKYYTDVNKGKNVHYSYDLITKLCNPDSEFWVHFIEH
jgi:uncharacterized protein YvpB